MGGPSGFHGQLTGHFEAGFLPCSLFGASSAKGLRWPEGSTVGAWPFLSVPNDGEVQSRETGWALVRGFEETGLRADDWRTK